MEFPLKGVIEFLSISLSTVVGLWCQGRVQNSITHLF